MTATLTGNIRVSDLADLSYVHAAKYQNGTRAWVDAEQAEYVLLKDAGLVANGSTVLAPLSGSPIAGNALATWVRMAGSATTLFPGATAVQWQAAIAAANQQFLATGLVQTVQLVTGTYDLTQKIDLLDGVDLNGAGRDSTVLHPLYSGTGSPLVGGVLDPSNCVLSIRGALDTTTMDTVPTSTFTGVQYVPSASPAVSVADKGSIAAGNYFVYGGHNDVAFGGFQQNQMGPLLDWREILQVDVVVPGVFPAATLQLKDHTLLHHTLTNGGVGVPITCKAVVPRTQVRVRNLSIRNPGGTVAVGIFREYAKDVSTENVGFEGFTLSCFFDRVAQQKNDINPYSFGENNCMFWSDSSHQETLWNPQTNPEGLRENAQGRTFGMLMLYNNSAEWSVFGGSFEHVDLAVQLWGALQFKMVGTRVRDTDIDALLFGDQVTWNGLDDGLLNGGSFAHSPAMGCGIDLGSVSLAVNQFNTGIQFTGVTLEDTRAGTAFGANDESASLWWHDSNNCQFTGFEILNVGRSPLASFGGVTKGMNGIRVQDVSGLMTGFLVVGCQWSFRNNSSQGIEVRHGRLMSAPGAGPIPTLGLTFNMNTPSNSTFEDLYIQGLIHFEAGWNGADQDFLHCARWNIDGNFIPGQFFPTLNRTGGGRAPGDIVAMDTTSAGFRQTTNAAPANADPAWALTVTSNFTTSNNAWMFTTRAAGGSVNTSAAVNYGDALQAHGGGTFQAEPTVAPTVLSFIGISESHLAASGAALVTR